MNNKENDTTFEKLDMQSHDIVSENISKVQALFPNCVTEAADGLKIDFDLLKQELSTDIVDGRKERYRLEWPGKRESLLMANTPTTKTLRPVREDSVDFDNTKNIYIEGDNLEVLKLLQGSYHGKIKMIYIDPPYNTGKDFVYSDKFAQDKSEYEEESGQVDEDGNQLFLNKETNGRYHSDWLSMMYPRLKLAKNLLSSDGVLVIYMDEHEITNLNKLLQEVLGENNDLGTIIWDKRNPKGDSQGIAYQHEYISFFAKNKEAFLSNNSLLREKKNAHKILNKASSLHKEVVDESSLSLVNKEFSKWISNEEGLTGGERAYNKIDELGQVYQSVSMAWPNKKQSPPDYQIPLIHPKTGKECKLPPRGWRNPSSTMKSLLDENLILFGEDHTTQPRRKYLLKDNMLENISSLLYNGKSDTKLLDEIGIPFDTPKVVDICIEHIDSIASHGDIILDFFSGSATSAHAVMGLNSRKKDELKYIQVQLPEKTDEKSEAYKAGYQNICEIGKERIRRAAKKIKEETGVDIDYGFRVYRLDESNMNDVYYLPQDYEQGKIQEFSQNIKMDRTAEDLLTQIILDWGLPLSLPIEQDTIGGKKVYKVAGDSLFACFDMDIDESFAEAVAEYKPHRLVFKDNSFSSNTAKINMKQVLMQLCPETEVKVI